MITIEKITEIVAKTSNTPIDQILGKSRKREFVQPRFVAMKLAKEFTKDSLVKIGNYFGGRDHTTTIHAIQTINDYIDIRANQPMESALYFTAKDNLHKYLVDTNGISQSILLTPHQVPVC
jgi:chromosomal replication initiation ATPase DnaA